MPIQYTPLANLTYLDYDSYRSDAPSPTGAGAIGNFTFNVALVLDRANDPTALLQSDWASRQQQLERLFRLRPGQRSGERIACRPSVELRPQRLGLGRHLWRR